MNIELLETECAEQVLVYAIDFAGTYAEADDLDAAVVALLVRALELGTGRNVSIEGMYKC